MSQDKNQKPQKKSSTGFIFAIIIGCTIVSNIFPALFRSDSFPAVIFALFWLGMVTAIVVANLKSKNKQEQAKKMNWIQAGYDPKQLDRTQSKLVNSAQSQQSRAQALKQAFEQRLTEEQAQDRPFVRRPSNAGDGHVPTIGLDVSAKLEQLETLNNAGLLDPEEYIAKKNKILRRK